MNAKIIGPTLLHLNDADYQIAAGNSRCPCQFRLIYEFDRHIFISTSRSAAVPEL
jgi:hypothetical protein